MEAAVHQLRETLRYLGSGRTVEGETEMAKKHAQRRGSAAVSDGDVTAAVAEDPPRAGWVCTAKAVRRQHSLHRFDACTNGGFLVHRRPRERR